MRRSSPPPESVLQFRQRFPGGRVQPEQTLQSEPQPAKVGPWLSAASAAAFYDFSSVKAFRSWAVRNHIIPAKFGRLARYAKADIDALARRVGSSSVHNAIVKEARHAR